MPKISVIIPSYNHAAYLGEAICSVLEQTEPDLELIIVDDGSSDDSLKVAASFNDARIQIIPQTNQGAHAAINRGLNTARGDFLAILNSDDMYISTRLEKMLAALNADAHTSLACSYIELIDAQGKHLTIKHGYQDLSPWPLASPERSFRRGDDLHAALLTENYLATTSNYVFTRAWYEKVGEFLPLRYTHDWDFALRILANDGKLALLPEPLVRYRLHTSNTIRENQIAMIFEILWIFAVHIPQAFDASGICAADADLLLHSLHTFEAETGAAAGRVLTGMLLQQLHRRPDLAQQLLETANPIRQVYLQYLAAGAEATAASTAHETHPPPEQIAVSAPASPSSPAPATLLQRIIRRIQRQWK